MKEKPLKEWTTPPPSCPTFIDRLENEAVFVAVLQSPSLNIARFLQVKKEQQRQVIDQVGEGVFRGVSGVFFAQTSRLPTLPADVSDKGTFTVVRDLWTCAGGTYLKFQSLVFSLRGRQLSLPVPQLLPCFLTGAAQGLHLVPYVHSVLTVLQKGFLQRQCVSPISRHGRRSSRGAVTLASYLQVEVRRYEGAVHLIEALQGLRPDLYL